MLGVEHDNPELLDATGAVLRQQKGRELAGRRKTWTLGHGPHKGPPPQLDRRQHLSRLGRADSGHMSEVVGADTRQSTDTPCTSDESVRQLQSTSLSRAAAQHQRHQLVIAKSVNAESLQLLARPIAWCHIFHRRYTHSLMGLRFAAPPRFLFCLLLAVSAAGCAEPPNKEMDQAQGAIDAAQAAGADRYATSEYTAATEALENANTAVAASDHRLALSFALESREHAQNAARGAADAKARVHVEVDHASTELAALITEGRALLDAASRGGTTRATLAQPTLALSAAESALQEAGEAVGAGDYLGARAALEEGRTQIEQAISSLGGAAPAQPSAP